MISQIFLAHLFFITVFSQHLFEHVKLKSLFTEIEKPIDPIVDFKLIDFERVFHPGNLCPFQRKVLAKMAHGQNINIEVLGGSATYGVELSDIMKERWTTKLETYLNSGWYSGHITVTNRGIRACNIDAWIYQTTRFTNADLVIVDLSVNDQHIELQALPHYYKALIQLLDDLPNHPAIMFSQTFRLAQKNMGEIQAHCPNPGEYGTCCGGCLWCRRWWDMHDFVTSTLVQYKVPYTSYRDLVWPVYSSPSENLPFYWDRESHPGAKVHALIAKMIAFSFLKQVQVAHALSYCAGDASERYIYGSSIDKDVVSICQSPLTKLSAQDSPDVPTSFEPHVDPQNSLMWRYYNDSGSKFGWILNQNLDSYHAACAVASPAPSRSRRLADAPLPCATYLDKSSIAFDIVLGSTPTIQINYLKSYTEEMGTAILWVDDNKADYLSLPGRWSDEYSVAHFVTITASPMINVSAYVLGDSLVLPSLTPGKHVLHIAGGDFKSKDFKWKLLSVISC